MKGQALLAGWIALCSYDQHRGVPIEKFVKAKVKASLLQRHRDEWRFARRCFHFPHDGESDEAEVAWDGQFADLSDDVFWWRVEVRDILTRLPPREHYLIERLFIDGATEREVSRWKQQVLEKLRRMIRERWA